jgi:endonuclease/exonuclease/phosphatase (EEP) superfamily protein YafD
VKHTGPDGHRVVDRPFASLSRASGRALIASGLGATVAGAGARLHWGLELFSHFPAQLAGGLLVAVGLALWGGSRRWAAVGLLAMIPNAWAVGSLYVGAPDAPTGAPTVRLTFANVLTMNRHHAAFMEQVRAADPDVLAVVELGAAWEAAIGAGVPHLPHRHTIPREDNFGMGLYSRWPIAHLEVVDPVMPSIVAALDTPHGPLNVIVTHPIPPMGPWPTLQRATILRDIARRAARVTGPVVVAGDLNASPWAPVFEDFIRDSGLRHGRMGRGLQISWPTFIPPLSIPIDHVFAGGGARIVAHEMGHHFGSDHLPLNARIEVAPAAGR